MRSLWTAQGSAATKVWRFVAVIVLASHTCLAAPVTVVLGPATARIGLTVLAVGAWPVPGQFERFSGQLTVDPTAASDCRVSVEVEVASLRMAGAGRTRLALGPSLLDAVRYPRLAYTGTCSTSESSGQLTLHGVTRPLSLTPHLDGDKVNATGSLRRQDFGVTGLPGLIGRRVDLLLSINLPPGLARRTAVPPAGSNFSAAPFMQ